MWFLWPSGPRLEGGRRREPPGTRVAYGVVRESLVMNPTLFARSTRVGFHLPEPRTHGMTQMRTPEPARQARFLHVAAPVISMERLGMRTDSSELAAASLEGFRTAWQPESGAAPVAAPAPVSSQLVVRVRGVLAERGFRLAEENLGPAALAGSWDTEVVVEIDAAGVPLHVFVEEGSGRADVDAMLVRALRRSRAEAGAAPASGRVAVSFGD